MPLALIEVTAGDTARFPSSMGTYASRIAVLVGNAVALAAGQERDDVWWLPEVMRMRRQPLHPPPHLLAIQLRIELGFERVLLARIRKPENRLRGGVGVQREREQEKDRNEAAHERGFYALRE